ncbi:galactosyl transferase [Mesorhizobium sp. NZP2077]|uniref:galactosyl transferase n=1 Tax=Mesorhizobium sp. NZP2077 TaxID=2483404 RepID=UPI001556E599|nr:galactosyl transferase [Mesorhizobium sp. NZP2077]QKD13823.1 galactosyl transferase [Mesorhizobium sp. NZP2077]
MTLAPPDQPQIIDFIIPVRHPTTVVDWEVVKKNLSETIKSISAQTAPNWRAVIIANDCADLPETPPGFTVRRVNFPPKFLPSRDVDPEAFFEAVRSDKGRRILEGFKELKPSSYVMIVDYDDFISNRLAAHVADKKAANGWYFSTGYVYSGSRLTYIYHDFFEFCGTSLIIRADLFGLPDDLSQVPELIVRRNLGSHKFITKDLEARGQALESLPYPGAVYRVGHQGTTSGSRKLLSEMLPRWMLRHRPIEYVRRATRFRWMTASRRREFSIP